MKISYRRTSNETAEDVNYAVTLSVTDIDTESDAQDVVNHLKKSMLAYEGQSTLDDDNGAPNE